MSLRQRINTQWSQS